MIVLRFCMQGKVLLNILMANVMCLHTNMQEKEIPKHTHIQVSFVRSQLVDHCVV